LSKNKQDKFLKEGYKRLFGKEPEAEMGNWQMAALVMEGLDPIVMGQRLAKQCVFRVFKHIPLDADKSLVESVFFLAESNARQFFWPNLTEEVSKSDMAAYEYLEGEHFWNKIGD